MEDVLWFWEKSPRIAGAFAERVAAHYTKGKHYTDSMESKLHTAT